VALARAEPDRFTFANPFTGSPHRLGYEMLAREAGIRLAQAEYRGGGPALNDVLAGHVHLGVFSLGAVRRPRPRRAARAAEHAHLSVPHRRRGEPQAARRRGAGSARCAPGLSLLRAAFGYLAATTARNRGAVQRWSAAPSAMAAQGFSTARPRIAAVAATKQAVSSYTTTGDATSRNGFVLKGH
jgi:hypothetical protein